MRKQHIITANKIQYNFFETDTLQGLKIGYQVFFKGCNTMTDFINLIHETIEFNAKHNYIIRYVLRNKYNVYIAMFFKLGEKYQ